MDKKQNKNFISKEMTVSLLEQERAAIISEIKKIDTDRDNLEKLLIQKYDLLDSVTTKLAINSPANNVTNLPWPKLLACHNEKAPENQQILKKSAAAIRSLGLYSFGVFAETNQRSISFDVKYCDYHDVLEKFNAIKTVIPYIRPLSIHYKYRKQLCYLFMEDGSRDEYTSYKIGYSIPEDNWYFIKTRGQHYTDEVSLDFPTQGDVGLLNILIHISQNYFNDPGIRPTDRPDREKEFAIWLETVKNKEKIDSVLKNNSNNKTLKISNKI